VSVEALAEIGRQAVDIAAQLEQRIASRLAGQGANGGADSLRLRPTSFAREDFKAVEIVLVEVDLERLSHETVSY
jgi:hypothetical protein